MHSAAGKTSNRLDKILKVLQDPGFLLRTGHGNELGFHVFDYPPEDELLVRDYLDYLKGKDLSVAHGIRPVFLDLYEEVLELLGDRGVLDKIPAQEEKEPTGFAGVLTKLHRGVLRPENIVQHLLRKVEPDHNLIVLTGVGKVFPLVRSHSVLNNMHHPLGEKSVLLFFPGGYDQKELSLFCRMKDDNYYRAFRLVGDQ